MLRRVLFLLIMHSLQQAFAPEYWSNWTLVVVGAATAIAAILTLRSIRQQVVSGEKAADAALLNAKALITAERPWLVVTIERPPHSDIYIFQATNKGNTPAYLEEGHFSHDVDSISGFDPPDNLCAPFFAPPEALTVGGASFEMGRINGPDTMHVEPKPDLGEPGTLYVFGRLVYWDTLTDRSKPNAKPYITQWCFRYDPFQKKFLRASGNFTIYT